MCTKILLDNKSVHFSLFIQNFWDSKFQFEQWNEKRPRKAGPEGHWKGSNGLGLSMDWWIRTVLINGSLNRKWFRAYGTQSGMTCTIGMRIRNSEYLSLMKRINGMFPFPRSFPISDPFMVFEDKTFSFFVSIIMSLLYIHDLGFEFLDTNGFTASLMTG